MHTGAVVLFYSVKFWQARSFFDFWQISGARRTR